MGYIDLMRPALNEMGNEMSSQTLSACNWGNVLLEEISRGKRFYFVHSDGKWRKNAFDGSFACIEHHDLSLTITAG